MHLTAQSVTIPSNRYLVAESWILFMFFLKKIKLISYLLLVVLILAGSISICSAQNSIRNKHNLGLFNEIASDTISDGIGRIYESTEHLRFNLMSNVTEEPVFGDTRSSVAADFDNDGDIDILLCSTTILPVPSTLLINDGTGHFTISCNSGLPKYISNIICGDLNNDGYSDLILAGADNHNSELENKSQIKDRPRKSDKTIFPWTMQLLCFYNNGNGTFSNQKTDFTEFYNYTPPAQMVLSDINCDGFLDFISSVHNQPGNTLLTWVNSSNGFIQSNNLELPFHRQELDKKGLISLFDINEDNYPDILFHNNPSHFGVTTKIYQLINTMGKFFEAELTDYPLAPINSPLYQLDIDNDLDFDAISSTNDAQGSRTPLYLNENGSFKNIGKEAGLWLGYNISNNFCTGDLDNDGFIDLIPNLHGSYNISAKTQLFRNLGDNRFATSFEAFSPQVFAKSFSTTFADLDGDLDLDIIIPNSYGYVDLATIESSALLLYKNESKTGNSIMFDLRGTNSNRDAIGARIIVSTGDLSMIRLIEKPPFDVHFGIGDHTEIEKVRVEWPSGLNELWYNMPAGKTWVLIEGSAETDH